MKIRNIISLSLLLFSFSSLVHAMELVERRSDLRKFSQVAAVSSASDLKLYTNQKDFYVEDESAAYRVERYDMNPLLQEVIHRKALGQFVGDGYIRVNKLEDGKYALMAKVRGEGGFLLTGVIVYQSCRVIGYSGLVVGSIGTIASATVAGGPLAGWAATTGVIAASTPVVAAIESGSLTIGVAASWIPWLP